MSSHSAFSFDATGDPIIDVMTDGFAWDLSDSTTLTWALADGLNGDAWTDRFGAIDTFAAALASVEQFIDVEFQYLGDFDSPIAAGLAGADLVYTLDNAVVDDGTLAYAYYPGPGVFPNFEQYETEGGDVFMNFSAPIINTSSFRPGSDGFLTVIHELGHALGLRHPFESSAQRPSLDQLDQTLVRDVDWFSIMSYTDDFGDQLERWDPATPMLLDVLALQYLYGANPATNAGNSLLRLDSEAFYYTLWDVDGVDWVDASDQSEGWTIFLPDVQVTELVDTLSGFALPSDQFDLTIVDSEPQELIWLMGDIENAIGTRLEDRINGNRFDNHLRGGGGDDALEGFAGDDTLEGNAGRDIAWVDGDQASFTLSIGPDGTFLQDRRPDGLGTDRLIGIEEVAFRGGDSPETFDLDRFGGPATLSSQALETLVELYVAYFNRAPDAVGLNFWGTVFAQGGRLEQIAAEFSTQPETRALYREELDNADFATAVYTNLFGRIPDQTGFDFWVDMLDSTRVGRDTFILAVLEGAKADPSADASQAFIDQQLADRAFLDIKTDLGALYAVHYGLSDVTDANNALAGFNGSQSSLDAAVGIIDEYHAAALDPDDGAFLMPLVGVLDNPFDVGA